MAIQLASDPKIKINGEELQGYLFLGFKMTKRLLEPNRFDFLFRKEDMSLTQNDIKFELREKLLGSLVECSVSAYRMDAEGNVSTDNVENFFRGYIQHIKLERENNKAPMVIRCTAFSPDSRLKQYPGCSSRLNCTLAKYVGEMVYGPSEGPCQFDAKGGNYEGTSPIAAEIKPRNTDPMPYTVQYHESSYDFLKRLAKRYGEFFYYEEGTLYFGEMKEYDPETLRTGIDIEQYRYDLNMNEHLGIVLSEYDYNNNFRLNEGGVKKGKGQWKQTVESIHEMSQSAYQHAIEYFNDDQNIISDTRSARFFDENESIKLLETGDTSSAVYWSKEQHEILDKYVMADTLICSGKSRRANLKLGSVMVIEDETSPVEGKNTDLIQHEPLKVIDLVYVWKYQDNRSLENWFKAIPQKSTVPPYLERDRQGFLTYGDFDVFPYCGPQHGRVVDNKDPLRMGRVKVVLCWQFLQENINGDVEEESEVTENITPWIRVSQPYAGMERGTYLVPEIGDEVIVAFEHNNAECPYVAGVVHNYAWDYIPFDWNKEKSVEDNEFKAIRTRNGHTIEIRDKGKHGYIKIYDEKTHNYVVTLDTDRSLIRIESAGNIELDAKENIVMHAGKNVNIQADENIEATAGRDIKAKAEFNSELRAMNILRRASLDIRDFEGCDYVNVAQSAFIVNLTNDNVDEGSEMSAAPKGDNTAEITKFNTSFKLDRYKASLEIDDLGITGKTENNIELKADKLFTLSSGQVVKITADGDAKLAAKRDVSIDGVAQTKITGATVKIN